MARYMKEKDVVNLMYSLHLDKMKFNNNKNVIDFIKDIPTADVVEVVRCKDCVHFTKGMAIGMCKRVEERPIIPVTYDHYCSYGKKVE